MFELENWVSEFTVTAADIDYLSTIIYEKEIPLKTSELARLLVEKQLTMIRDQLAKEFENVLLYNPAHQYQVGDRLLFSAFDFAVGEVQSIREGNNDTDPPFSVLQIEFEDGRLQPEGQSREFASNYAPAHKLNQINPTQSIRPDTLFTVEDVLNSDGFSQIEEAVNLALEKHATLVRMANQWFIKDLILETNDGHLHLAEAILDIHGGGPLTTEQIVQDIGGIGQEALPLQVFSMNYKMKDDARFDEVGPVGEVLWFLKQLEPSAVQRQPDMLAYQPIPYDRTSLSREALQLEAELKDEYSPLKPIEHDIDSAAVHLIYPHRRLGTLPLNQEAERIFPFALRTERIYTTVVDLTDGERYQAWVVRKHSYVYGLLPLYQKHSLPIGSTVILRAGETKGEISLQFGHHASRIEWVPIITMTDGKIGFQNVKRSLSAEFDPLMLLGVDDLEGIGKLFQVHKNQQQPLASILRTIIPPLGQFTARGSVHAKTIYSAVNIIRRCPPGPILATLENNPDFDYVGDHYWKLSH